MPGERRDCRECVSNRVAGQDLHLWVAFWQVDETLRRATRVSYHNTFGPPVTVFLDPRLALWPRLF